MYKKNHTSNGGIAATQASAKQTSLMLGNDNDETQLVLKTFYNWRDEQRFHRNGGVRGVLRFENKVRA